MNKSLWLEMPWLEYWFYIDTFGFMQLKKIPENLNVNKIRCGNLLTQVFEKHDDSFCALDKLSRCTSERASENTMFHVVYLLFDTKKVHIYNINFSYKSSTEHREHGHIACSRKLNWFTANIYKVIKPCAVTVTPHHTKHWVSYLNNLIMTV